MSAWRTLLMGPPGAGKGTQAERLVATTGGIHIATGDMFRRVAASGTDLGNKVRDIMARGDYVPDNITIEIIEARLQEADAQAGFVLDGFPRTTPQAEALTDLLERLGQPLQAALLLEVPQAELVARLSGRRSCGRCGAVYHLRDRPPKEAGRCDRCGGELTAREDDGEETVRRRLEVYAERTRPVVGYYRERGLLCSISGIGPVDEVQARMLEALGAA